MKRLVPFVVPLLLAGCSCSEDAPHGETRVNPKDVERVPPPTDQAEIGPPEIIEPEADPADGVRLRVVYQEGERVEREISGDGTVTMSPATDKGAQATKVETTISIKFSTEVVSVSNGSARIKVQVQPVEVKTSEGEGSRTQGEQFEVTVDERGRVLTNLAGLVRSSAALAFVPFPEKRVKPGSTWRVKATLDAPTVGLMEIVQSYTYRGLVSREGRKVWQVDTKGGAEGKVSIDGSYYFDPTDGHLVAGNWDLSGTLEAPAPDGSLQEVKATIRAAVKKVAKAKG